MLRLSFRRLGLVASLLLVFGSLSVPNAASAAPEKEELNRARGKFQQATELEQAKNWGAALQLFREVGQVRMTPQVRYHIGLCEENLGKLVAALGGYELALAEAESMGPEFQKEVEGRTTALRGRIPKLVIERGEGAEAATIELDGISLGASSVGVEVPLDPGPHTVMATAPQRETFSETITVPEQKTEHVVITLKKSDSASPGGGSAGNASGGSVTYTMTRPSRTLPYVIGAGGGVLLVAGGVSYLFQRKMETDLDRLCGAARDCVKVLPADQLAEADKKNSDRRLYNTLAIALPIGGGIALGVAAVLLLTESRSAPPPAKTASWRLYPGAPGANSGLSVIGQF